MRLTVWSTYALALPLLLAGCGGSETSTPSATTTTTVKASAVPPTTVAGGQDDEYELDVIAEAEPD